MKLSKALEERLAAPVRAGRYTSAEEYLTALLDRDEVQAASAGAIRKAVAEGQAELDEGLGIPGADVFADLREMLHQRRRHG